MTHGLREFWLFGVKQAYACVFGGFLLAVMLGTRLWYPFEALHRYDFIFIAAVVFQLVLLALQSKPCRHLLARCYESVFQSE